MDQTSLETAHPGNRVPYYLAVLREAFESRQRRNPRYSLRTFARALGVDCGVLSLVLSGKRIPSESVARQIPAALKLEDQTEAFLLSILEEKRVRKIRAIDQSVHSRQSEVLPQPLLLSHEQFEKQARWYYGVIAELTRLQGFQPDAAWIAQRIGISTAEASEALEHLLDSGVIIRGAGGEIRKAPAARRVESGDRARTSEVLRRRQREILSASMKSLDTDPIEVRNHSDLTLAIDPARIGEAKEMIRDFVWQLATRLGTGVPSQVYQLHVAFFPAEPGQDEGPRR